MPKIKLFSILLVFFVACNTAQAQSKISDEDKRLLQHYGACASIKQSMIFMYKKNGANEFVNMTAHQASIYSILALKIVEKYPESLMDEAFNIANRFLKTEILDKSLNGPQLNTLQKNNGGCGLDEVSHKQINFIMNDEKSRYEKMYAKNKSL